MQTYSKNYSDVSDKPPLEQVKKKIHAQLLTQKKELARKLWWQEQYRHTNIQIKNPRFKDVLNMLRNPEQNSTQR